jgi:hypothetical protein
MAQLDFQQVHDLADNFMAMAKAIGEYRYNNPNMPVDLDKKIKDSHRAVLKYATDLYTLSAIIIIIDTDVAASLLTISDITAQIKETYAKLQKVQKAIDVAASIVSLGAALFSKDPSAVGKSINDLVNIWNKPIPSFQAKSKTQVKSITQAKRKTAIKPKKKI